MACGLTNRCHTSFASDGHSTSAYVLLLHVSRLYPICGLGPSQRDGYASAVVGRCVRRGRAPTAAVDLQDEAVDAWAEGDTGHDQRAGFVAVGEGPCLHRRPDDRRG